MEHVWVDVDGLALDLVGPAAVVAEAADDGADVAAGQGDGLAVVERLDGGQEVHVLLAQLGQLDQVDAALLRGGAAPDAIKGLARGGDGDVDILLGGLVHGADDLFCGRVDDLERLLLDTLDELVVDEAGERVLVSRGRSNEREGTYSPVGCWKAPVMGVLSSTETLDMVADESWRNVKKGKK